jgi:hypothetical protein
LSENGNIADMARDRGQNQRIRSNKKRDFILLDLVERCSMRTAQGACFEESRFEREYDA